MNLEFVSLEKEIIFNWFEGLVTKSIAELEDKPFKNGKLDYYRAFCKTPKLVEFPYELWRI
jgi:hypothetical protein